LAGWRTSNLYRSITKLCVYSKTVKPSSFAHRNKENIQRGAKRFAISRRLFQAKPMTEPLALVLYERLLPGTRIVNRLQDLKYRVQTLADAKLLTECAEQSKPMLVVADFEAGREDVCAAIARLKQNSATQHLPVIGFGNDGAADWQAAAQTAGATLVVSETAILAHLPQCLERALEIE
jgi:CheY-like chemotaxis protein